MVIVVAPETTLAQRLVVVDTVLLHFQAWKKMFNEYGHEFTFEDYKQKVDGIPQRLLRQN